MRLKKSSMESFLQNISPRMTHCSSFQLISLNGELSNRINLLKKGISLLSTTKKKERFINQLKKSTMNLCRP